MSSGLVKKELFHENDVIYAMSSQKNKAIEIKAIEALYKSGKFMQFHYKTRIDVIMLVFGINLGGCLRKALFLL